MARRQKKGKAHHQRVVQLQVSPGRIDAHNPWHILWMVLIVVLLLMIAMWAIRMLIPVVVIVGIVYALYLLMKKK